MDISNIISISGMSGLYKVVAQAKNGVVVESLADKKRFTAFSSHRISALEDISIYSTSDDVPLKEVLKKIYDKEKGGKAMEVKGASDADLRSYMSSVMDNYDEERVHTSDLKKLFTWYNLLHEAGLLESKETEETEAEKKKKLPEKEKAKPAAVKKETAVKSVNKTNAPKVKAQGVRKTGSA
ncbi:MAG: hypothetical protein Fur0041_09650 [Bacteroidia bacterium]